MISKFPPSVVTALAYYVYIYSHPETNEVFYVGKGKGNRAFDHLFDAKSTEKTSYIASLRNEGLQPKIEILIHGLEHEETALRVEAAVIDLIGKDNLTNLQNGFKSGSYGRLNLRQIISLYERTSVDVDDPAIAVRISKRFYPTISPIELYDITRAQWRLNVERARKADIVLAVFQGIIQEVYTVLDWYEGGSTFNSQSDISIKGRSEFIGQIAPEALRSKYLYKSIDHYYAQGNQNPVMYLNV